MQIPHKLRFGTPTLACVLAACTPSTPTLDGSTGSEETSTSTGEETSEPPGDGDGDTPPGDGDGDTPPGDGDGDEPPGDGDGDEPPGDGDGDEPPGDGDGDGDTSGDGDGDTSGDGDGDEPGDGDGDEPGDGDGDEPGDDDGFVPGEEPCIALEADPDAFIALIVGETNAFLLRQDGSTLALDTSLPDAEPGAELALRAGVGEGWVNVISYDDVEVFDEDQIAPEHDLAHYRVWSQATGELAWEHVEAGTISEPDQDPVVGVDGRVAVLVPVLDDGTLGRVVGEQGVLGSFYNCIPESAVGPDDWHACVSFLEPSPRWANAILDQSVGAPDIFSDLYFRYEVLPDGTFRYVGDVEGEIGLMEARVDTFDFTPWPEAQPLFEGWQLRAQNFAARWFVFRDGGDYQLMRFGEDALPLTAPPDHPSLRSNSARALPVTDGAMLLGWANDDVEVVYVHEGADAGVPFPGFRPISGHSRTYVGVTEGTYWLRTRGNSNTWGPPPPEALVGDTMQIARPSTDTEFAFEVFGSLLPDLHDSGRCLARPVSAQADEPWRIDDLDNQQTFELPEAGYVLWL